MGLFPLTLYHDPFSLKSLPLPLFVHVIHPDRVCPSSMMPNAFSQSLCFKSRRIMMRTTHQDKGQMISLMVYDGGYVMIHRRFETLNERTAVLLLSEQPNLLADSIEIHGKSIAGTDHVFYLDVREPIRSKLFGKLTTSFSSKKPGIGFPVLVKKERLESVKTEFPSPMPINPYAPPQTTVDSPKVPLSKRSSETDSLPKPPKLEPSDPEVKIEFSG